MSQAWEGNRFGVKVSLSLKLPSPLWQGEHVQYVNANYNENGKLIIESVVMMAITTVKRK